MARARWRQNVYWFHHAAQLPAVLSPQFPHIPQGSVCGYVWARKPRHIVQPIRLFVGLVEQIRAWGLFVADKSARDKSSTPFLSAPKKWGDGCFCFFALELLPKGQLLVGLD